MEHKLEFGEPIRLTLEEVNILAYIPTEDFKKFLSKAGINELNFAKGWSRLQPQLQFVSFMGFESTKIKLDESAKVNVIAPIAAYRKLYAEDEGDLEVIDSILEKCFK